MGAVARALLALAAMVACGAAAAQSVALQGMMGRKALLIIDGAPPRMVAPGETHKGVKVLSTLGDQAVVEIDGKRQTLRVGDAPASVGARTAAGGAGGKIVLPVDRGGHFIAQGTINGRAVQFMVDTGATAVAMGAADAQRLGLDYKKGRVIAMGTANGTVPGYVLKLSSVRVGDVEVYDVDAIVTAASMPYVLLGNSFLNRFQMRRDSEQMVLEKRY
jgi:aspartyl protease family protein